MDLIRIFLLGTPHVDSHGAPVEFDTRKATALLAFLAVTGGTHQRDSLATLLWPELDQIRARAALRRTLSTLKNAIGGNSLEINRETIRIIPEKVWIDVTEFRRLAESCHAHEHSSSDTCPECTVSLEKAVALYQGDFLAGFTLRDSRSFDDWQFYQTEGLRGELAGIFKILAACYTSQGEYASAIGIARRWLSLDPLHEEVHRQLMRLYAYSGRREAALRQYQECLRILDQELGVAPLEETKKLFEEIKENRLSPPSTQTLSEFETIPPVPRIPSANQTQAHPPKVDVSNPPFVGRSSEWRQLLEIYSSTGNNGHLFILEGETGVGKTRLAEEFLTYINEEGATTVVARCYEGERTLSYGPFIDGLRAGLNQISQSDWLDSLPKAWLAEVARLLPELHEMFPDLPAPPHPETPGAQSRFFEAIAQFLLALTQGPKPGVLFIDDLQWADSASLDLLAYLVRRLTGRSLFILSTWRGEDVRSGDPLHQLLVDALRTSKATLIHLPRLTQPDVQVLVEALADYGLPERISMRTQLFSDRLFEETEGLPFFLSEYLSALLQGEDLPDESDWPLPGSIREVLNSRLAEVGETGRQLLSTAAVIGRSFGFDTLKEASGRGEEEIISSLEQLVARGFISELQDLGEEKEPLYDFRHEKIRTQVYTQTSLARRRLLHRRAAEALVNRSRISRQPARYTSQIAHHYTQSGEMKAAAHYFKLAGEHARALYANNDAINHFRAALEAGHPECSDLHEAIGDLQTLLGEYTGALGSYTLAEKTGPGNAVSRLEHKIGHVYQRQGEWEQAEGHYRRALEASPVENSTREKIQTLVDWSLVAFNRKDLDHAQTLALQALEYAQKKDDPYALCQVHNILGVLARNQKDLKNASFHLEQSLAIAEDLADPGMRAAALNNLALVSSATQDLDRAIVLTEKALDLCILRGDRHREAALHSNLADLLYETGRPEGALEHLKKSAIIFSEIGAEAGDLNPEVWKLIEW